MSASLPDGLLDPQPQLAAEPGHAPMEIPTADHIPGLEELLPEHRGRPGFVYLQVTVKKLLRAKSEGWLEVYDGMGRPIFYVIEGPKGRAEMQLLGRGRPIPGQPSDSGARACAVDQYVEELTGLEIPEYGAKDKEPAKES